MTTLGLTCVGNAAGRLTISRLGWGTAMTSLDDITREFSDWMHLRLCEPSAAAWYVPRDEWASITTLTDSRGVPFFATAEAGNVGPDGRPTMLGLPVHLVHDCVLHIGLDTTKIPAGDSNDQ